MSRDSSSHEVYGGDEWLGVPQSGASSFSSAAFARGVSMSGTSRVWGTLAGTTREGCTLHPSKKKISGREIISWQRLHIFLGLQKGRLPHEDHKSMFQTMNFRLSDK